VTGTGVLWPGATELAWYTAALCAGAGLWLLLDDRPARRRMRALTAGPPLRTRLPRLPDREARRVVLWCLAGGLLLSAWGASLLPLAAAVPIAPLAVRWWRRRRAAEAADRRRDEVIAFCVALAGEVRAGRPPAQAVAAAGTGGLGPPGAAVLAAARYGGDVAAALCAAADRPGAEGLRGVAACWSVAVTEGASLAAGLERVAAALRAERDEQEDLRTHLAGPRATALTLAGLPVAGLALGTLLGVGPVRVLLGTPVGLGCLAAGVVLEWAGVLWVARIARAAERAAS
jgi:tight adherence protein B